MTLSPLCWALRSWTERHQTCGRSSVSLHSPCFCETTHFWIVVDGLIIIFYHVISNTVPGVAEFAASYKNVSFIPFDLFDVQLY